MSKYYDQITWKAYRIDYKLAATTELRLYNGPNETSSSCVQGNIWKLSYKNINEFYHNKISKNNGENKLMLGVEKNSKSMI